MSSVCADDADLRDEAQLDPAKDDDAEDVIIATAALGVLTLGTQASHGEACEHAHYRGSLVIEADRPSGEFHSVIESYLNGSACGHKTTDVVAITSGSNQNNPNKIAKEVCSWVIGKSDSHRLGAVLTLP